VRTYYVLLGVDPAVSADDIKRAFRKEIARYHPDKVQHLGAEFQEIAAIRAAELTEAYRVLMDEEARRKYDDSLREAGGTAAPAAPARRPAPRADQPEGQRSTPEPDTSAPPAPDRRFQKERATTSDFVRKAGISRLRDAVAAITGGVPSLSVVGFEAAFDVKPKGGLFKKTEAPVRLLAKFVTQVDAAAVEACWPLAIRAARGSDPVYVLLLGGTGLAPANELAVAIAAQRRKSRGAGPVLIPVDVRDWDALFPPDAPSVVRAVVQWLREGKG
jgi:curved DNA-binding protein CbpA